MTRNRLGSFLCTLAIVLPLLHPWLAPARATTVEEVDAAIKKGVATLYALEQGDNWEAASTRADQNSGGTALAIYALLAAGERPQSNPRLSSAIEWLKKNDTKGIYALGLRAQVWNLIEHVKDQSVRDVIKKDAALLLEGARSKDNSGFRGVYRYTVASRDYDASASQYGVLGMWAMDRAGLELPDAYWQAVENAWKKNQNEDKGWSYQSGGDGKHAASNINMTAAGIATMFITQDFLSGEKGLKCTGNAANPVIDGAMGWMEKNLPGAFRGNRVDFYGLYGVERIGVASGYKYFGTLDWYKEGSDQLIRQAKGGNWSGKWGGQIGSTSFALLFLCRGRAPVVMNKLAYNLSGKGEGNWNQRPRDAANVVHYIAAQMERDLNWQIVNLRVPAEELHDSPILYISGNQALSFTPEEEAKLKAFVEQGGLILGHADCSDANFTKSFKALGLKLFKNAGEFRELPDDHPIYTRQQFLRKNWKSKPNVEELSNGVRALMLLIPSGDPAKAWQQADSRSKEDQFQLMSDIFLYAVEGKDLRYKGATYIVIANSAKAAQTIKVARLDVGDNSDPEPGGWRRLSAIMHNKYSTDLDATLVKPEGDALKDYKIAHLTGTGKFKLKAEQAKAIKAFVTGGGTLVVDAAGGDSEFATSAEDALTAMFGEDAKQLADSIPPDHALYKSTGEPLGEIAFRTFARGKVPRGQSTPLIRGIKINNRLAVIFSREDLSGALVGESIDGILGYAPDSATALMCDIIAFANGGIKAGTGSGAPATQESKPEAEPAEPDKADEPATKPATAPAKPEPPPKTPPKAPPKKKKK